MRHDIGDAPLAHAGTDTIRVVSMAVKCEDVRETDAVFASGGHCHPLFEYNLDVVGTRASASRPRSGLSRPPCAARMGENPW